jgi:hypothetical protein
VSIADAAKAANDALNLGYDIEIVVEAIGPGSFRAMLRAVYTQSRNLFSAESVRAVILGVIAAFIYERAFSVKPDIKVEISTNEVVIKSGNDRVVVPRQVYDATRLAEQNPKFGRAIDKTFHAVGDDEQVNGIAIVNKMDAPPPDFIITQDVIHQIDIDITPEPAARIIKEACDLQIVKAILERSSRKWEFMWRGVRTSAPVLDAKFYTDFFAHDITIAPGDELQVMLAITQERDDKTGIYTNVDYKVIEVFKHVQRLRQTHMPIE